MYTLHRHPWLVALLTVAVILYWATHFWLFGWWGLLTGALVSAAINYATLRWERRQRLAVLSLKAHNINVPF